MIFTQYNVTAFYVSCIDIFALLATAFYIMILSGRAKMGNFVETLGLYVGFSMYSGWVTTATVLNILFCLKGSGISEDKMDIDESIITCYLLWVITIVYTLVSYYQENAVYGSVWIWALVAISNRQGELYPNIRNNINLILIVYFLFIICLVVYKCYKRILANKIAEAGTSIVSDAKKSLN